MFNNAKKKQQGEDKPAEEATTRMKIDGLTEIEEAEAQKCSVAAATAKAAAATASAVAAFDEVAEHLNKQGLEEPTKPAGKQEAIAAAVESEIAEASVRASNSDTGAILETVQEAVKEAEKEAEAIQVELPASAAQDTPAVETVKSPQPDPTLALINGPTDDTRAPLDLTVKAKEEKPVKVKKPPFDWKGKVFDPLSKATTKVLDATAYGLKKTAEGILFIAAIIIMIVVNAPGGLLYAGGWLAKSMTNAVKNGWNQKPLTFIDLNEVMVKHNDPIAPAVAAT